MLIAKSYLSAEGRLYSSGEVIPDNALTAEQKAWLISCGALEDTGAPQSAPEAKAPAVATGEDVDIANIMVEEPVSVKPRRKRK